MKPVYLPFYIVSGRALDGNISILRLCLKFLHIAVINGILEHFGEILLNVGKQLRIVRGHHTSWAFLCPDGHFPLSMSAISHHFNPIEHQCTSNIPTVKSLHHFAELLVYMLLENRRYLWWFYILLFT